MTGKVSGDPSVLDFGGTLLLGRWELPQPHQGTAGPSSAEGDSLWGPGLGGPAKWGGQAAGVG